MAGGILSIAAGFAGQSTLSAALLAVTLSAFIVLAALNLLRAATCPDSMGDRSLVLVLFTGVAACGVLADSRGPLPGAARLGFSAIAITTWVGALVAVARWRGRLADGWRSLRVSGAWLLVVVATQSLAILAGAAAQQLGYGPLGALAAALWIAGLVGYGAVIALIVRRLARGAVGVDTFTPDYWITMGALAISTVAALDLIRTAATLDSSGGLRGGVEAVALITWVCGAGWIPYLLLLELARARTSGFSLRYDPQRWSTVFPLGMFSLATYELEAVIRLPVLGAIAGIAFWVGLGLALVNLGRAARRLASLHRAVC